MPTALDPNKRPNLLPKDGEVYQIPKFLDPKFAEKIWHDLLIADFWQRQEIVLFGKSHLQPRSIAFAGNPTTQYTYSGNTWKALGWLLPALTNCKTTIETFLNTKFNICLLNKYENGDEYMGYHADDEKELGPQPIIASLSLGASRDFCFKHKFEKQRIVIPLEHNDLLIMQGETQEFWKHALPKRKRINTPRINLTFRTII